MPEQLDGGGRFSYEDSNLHINIQELMTAKFSLMSYCSKYFFNHVRFKLDNSTAIAYINHIGGLLSLKIVMIYQWKFGSGTSPKIYGFQLHTSQVLTR